MIGSLVIDTCKNGHRFGKLMPDHPMKNDRHLCPVCLAADLAREKSHTDSLEVILRHKEQEIANLKSAAGMGNH